MRSTNNHSVTTPSLTLLIVLCAQLARRCAEEEQKITKTGHWSQKPNLFGTIVNMSKTRKISEIIRSLDGMGSLGSIARTKFKWNLTTTTHSRNSIRHLTSAAIARKLDALGLLLVGAHNTRESLRLSQSSLQILRRLRPNLFQLVISLQRTQVIFINNCMQRGLLPLQLTQSTVLGKRAKPPSLLRLNSQRPLLTNREL